jgi:hypothetical protein
MSRLKLSASTYYTDAARCCAQGHHPYWVYEIKRDGFRAPDIEGHHCELVSGRGRALLPSACLVSAALAMLMLVACGGDVPVTPSTSSCGNGGDLLGTGFGGAAVSGFTLDTSTLPNEGKGVTLRVGERALVRVNVGHPSPSNSCQSFPAFAYMKWSWNLAPVGTSPQDAINTPRTGPVEVTVASCSCRLFGEPYWTAVVLPLTATPQWEQRAWLDGEQRVELQVRAISPGSTLVFVTGFVGSPFTTANPVMDHSIYQLQFFAASVIP